MAKPEQCLAILLVTGLIWACSHSSPPEDKIRVAASIYPLADVVKQIGGERVEVEVLIPPGASPHVFEPTPEDYRRFSGAKLFVMVGAGLEFWAEKLIAANADDDLIVLQASKGVSLIQMRRHHHRGQQENVKHDQSDRQQLPEEHSSFDGNPHVWLDPVLVRDLAGRIGQVLVRLDPDHAGYYRGRTAQFQRQLDLLHETIKKTVAGFQTKEYVAFHPAWVYFSRRYGLQEVGVIQESPGRDPTPKQIEDIIQTIDKLNLKAIFVEPQHNPAAARAIAQETGVKILILDPLGGPDQLGRDSYIELMKYNLRVMSEAMR